MPHSIYKRHRTTTLFAAISVLDGTVIGLHAAPPLPRFIRFLNAVEHQVLTGRFIHAVLDNCATHKHPKMLAWLARHPRWIFIPRKIDQPINIETGTDIAIAELARFSADIIVSRRKLSTFPN